MFSLWKLVKLSLIFYAYNIYKAKADILFLSTPYFFFIFQISIFKCYFQNVNLAQHEIKPYFNIANIANIKMVLSWWHG